MGREKQKHGMKGRFLAMPHGVLDAPNFITLSYPGVRLLLDIARQYAGTNNGRLLVTLSLMKRRGWTSNDTLIRARRELESAGFIQQTRLPMMPRRAAWYGITWRPLDYLPEMDIKPTDFMMNAYLLTREEKIVTPSPGGMKRSIAPSPGGMDGLMPPSPGAVEAKNASLMPPSPGSYIDVAICTEH